MDQDRLQSIIEAEVRRVLEEFASGPSSPAPPSGERSLLVVFTGATVGLETAFAQLRALAEQGYRLTVALCDMARQLLGDRVRDLPAASNVLTGDPVAKVPMLVEASQAVVVPVFSLTAAAKLALGIADNFALQILMQAIITAKPVIAARNAVLPGTEDEATSPAPRALVQLAGNYLKTLESFGIQWVDIAELSERLNPKTTERYPSPDSGKVLITQSVIANLAPQVKELVIPNPAIVTPLARDLARQKGITLRFEKR